MLRSEENKTLIACLAKICHGKAKALFPKMYRERFLGKANTNRGGTRNPFASSTVQTASGKTIQHGPTFTEDVEDELYVQKAAAEANAGKGKKRRHVDKSFEVEKEPQKEGEISWEGNL